MGLIPRILAGNYGNSVVGLKASLQGHDVTVLADDNDVTKRSFNSEWPGLGKLKIVGVAASEWTQYEVQSIGQYYAGGILYFYTYSARGWRQETPVPLPTGLNYIPVWEERVYDSGYIYDDFLFITSNANAESTASGARSYHSGPSTAPANTIFLTPYVSVPGVEAVSNQNTSAIVQIGQPLPPYPAYPVYPPKPTYRPALAFVIYSTRLGDVT